MGHEDVSALLCRLIYARKTEGIPKAYPAPGVESTLQEVQQFLPDLEAKMIEFLAEWIVTLLSPATQIVKARASHLTFMFAKEYWFREFTQTSKSQPPLVEKSLTPESSTVK